MVNKFLNSGFGFEGCSVCFERGGGEPEMRGFKCLGIRWKVETWVLEGLSYSP